MKIRIHLDNNATTALDPEVYRFLQDELALDLEPANPSSISFFGKAAKARMDKSRAWMKNYFGLDAQKDQLLFTSSATEALNMLIKSPFAASLNGHFATTQIEHPAVYKTCEELVKRGVSGTFIQVTNTGAPTVQAIQEALKPETKLLVLSAANGVTGVKLDLESVAKLLSAPQYEKILWVVDAVALLGKERLILPTRIDAAVISAHKIHGPKGIGAALIRQRFQAHPLITGGNQEFKLRAGTENLLCIRGFHKALERLDENQELFTQKMLLLRTYFETELKKKIPSIRVNGTGERVCNTANICFPQLPNRGAESLLMGVDLAGIAASVGSACTSGGIEPSATLLNMGISYSDAGKSLRFSLSRFTTKEQIDYTVETLSNLHTSLTE